MFAMIRRCRIMRVESRKWNKAFSSWFIDFSKIIVGNRVCDCHDMLSVCLAMAEGKTKRKTKIVGISECDCHIYLR